MTLLPPTPARHSVIAENPQVLIIGLEQTFESSARSETAFCCTPEETLRSGLQIDAGLYALRCDEERRLNSWLGEEEKEGATETRVLLELYLCFVIVRARFVHEMKNNFCVANACWQIKCLCLTAVCDLCAAFIHTTLHGTHARRPSTHNGRP